MATYELKEYVHSEYGSGYGWTNTTTYNTNDNDNNSFYLGGSSAHYRCRLYFTIPSTLKIVSSEKIIVKLAGFGQNSGTLWTQYTRGHLTTTNTSSSAYENLANLSNPITSYLYKDAACTTQISGAYSSSSGNDVYMSFPSTGFKAGETYYIYMLPYGSNSAAIDSPTWTNTWMDWENNPTGKTSRLSVVLHYTDTVKITYDANGGTGAPAAANFTAGAQGTLSSTKPTKANTSTTLATITYNANGGATTPTNGANIQTTSYTFSSWTKNRDGSGDSYAAGGKITPGTSNITLYAQYTSSNSQSGVTGPSITRNSETLTRTVSFNSNGGSNVSALSSTATKTYSLTGWWSAASGGTKRASVNEKVYPTANATWYAQWSSSIGTYSSITLPNCSRTGYTFGGWSDGTNVYAAGASYTPSSNITLNAIWTAIYRSVNIYNSQTGAYIQSYDTILDGSSFTLPYLSLGNVRDHYTSSTLHFYDNYNDVTHSQDIIYESNYAYTHSYTLYDSATGDYLMDANEGYTITITQSIDLFAQFESTGNPSALISTPYISRVGYSLVWENDEDGSVLAAGLNNYYLEYPGTNASLYFTSLWTEDSLTEANFYFNKNDTMKLGTPYVKANGVYHKGIVTFVKVNGYWKSLNTIAPITVPTMSDTLLVTVENVGEYDFILQDDGCYYNSNQWYDDGENQTCCVAKVWFETAKETNIIIDCYQSSEAGYDYAVFSEIDTEINYYYEYMDERDYLPDGIYTTLKDFDYGDYNQGEPLLTTVEYTIPAGQHFIIIKFQKDGSVCNGGDTFNFMIMQ